VLTKKKTSTIIEPTNPDALMDQVKKLEIEKRYIKRNNEQLRTQIIEQEQEII